ncbi:MAG TPA: tetratricopeptide repeat protein, partial [Pyrinomonadaceae bacterium]|nr:tetratricopeptide repeat protein [Pyrinomonadaceae bacterium]
LWTGVGQRPDTTGLHPSVAAELLLCVGVLTCWIASKDQSRQGHEIAKDLISEGIAYYESTQDAMKVAAGRIELAYCYWYEGQLSEARIWFTEALQKLTGKGNTRARALVGLAIVEWSAARYDDARNILIDNAALFKSITDHTIKAIYHNQLAMVLRELAKSEAKAIYLRQAVNEYEEADRHLKLTRNVFFRVDLKNNVGNVLRQLGRYKEAHKYLAEARRLAVSAKDKLRVAQVDETRAQVLIAERKFHEAEVIVRRVVSFLRKTDRNALLAEALITQGTTLARLNQPERSQFCFQKAIEVARQVGASNQAGLASLTMIEEVELSRDELQAAFVLARQGLSECQSKELLLRQMAAADKVVSSLGDELSTEAVTDILLTKTDLTQAVLEHEGSLIRQALAKVNGSVTQAGKLLGLSHQGLAYIIEARHPHLITERTPIRRRQKKKHVPAE